MGTPAVPLAAASVDASGFSPDVQFNRQWLRTLYGSTASAICPMPGTLLQQGSGPRVWCPAEVGDCNTKKNKNRLRSCAQGWSALESRGWIFQLLKF